MATRRDAAGDGAIDMLDEFVGDDARQVLSRDRLVTTRPRGPSAARIDRVDERADTGKLAQPLEPSSGALTTIEATSEGAFYLTQTPVVKGWILL
jgi:hypothetical protein